MLLMNLRKIKLQVMKQEKGKKGSKKAKKAKKAKKGGKGKDKKVHVTRLIALFMTVTGTVVGGLLLRQLC
jgi:hypothetical protein